VAKYPPEKTEQFTTIPAATVRRIAREFGEAARIGETITIDGEEFPHRPAVVDWARGTQGHKHGFHNCWPLKLLNIVVGSVNVPGGILSTGAAGKFPHTWWPEGGGTDGMLEHGGHIIQTPFPSAFPGRTPTKPVRADIGELFPLAPHHHVLLPLAAENPSVFGLSDRDTIEVFLHAPINTILSSFGDAAKVERFFQSLRFMVGFAVEINETNHFDDIILPFPSYLERYDFISGQGAYLIGPGGQDDFHWQVRHPVVEPPPGVRQPQEVIQEIAHRLGILDGVYRMMNHLYRLQGDYALTAEHPYGSADVVDRMARSWFGEDRGLNWFKENGVIRHPTAADVAYIGPKLDARIPVYLEHFLSRREELEKVVDELKLDWDLSDYQPIGDFEPCPAYESVQKGEYDLVAVHFKFTYIYGAYGNENPWIDEICEATNAYRILLNESVGKRKGIQNGDEVWLESPVRKVKAIVKLTQCIHPEVVGVGGHFGHWAPGMPVSRGKGINFNSLCHHDLAHVDKISGALDHCVQVKIYKS
jgi:molybdopterin-containing oxidoreductase family molybdopterin binding subunit